MSGNAESEYGGDGEVPPVEELVAASEAYGDEGWLCHHCGQEHATLESGPCAGCGFCRECGHAPGDHYPNCTVPWAQDAAQRDRYRAALEEILARSEDARRRGIDDPAWIADPARSVLHPDPEDQ